MSHLPSKAKGAYVRPDHGDESEAVGLQALLTDLVPAGRRLAVREPDRVLLLVVDDDLVDSVVLFILSHRLIIPLQVPNDGSLTARNLPSRQKAAEEVSRAR